MQESIGNYVPGEALDVAIFIRSGTKRAHARVIPFPIEARGDGGCTGSAQAVLTGGRGFAILFQGFAPGEEVQLRRQYKTFPEENVKTIAEGGLIFNLVVFAAGDRRTVTHTATGSSCSVSLTHKVGEDAIVVQ